MDSSEKIQELLNLKRRRQFLRKIEYGEERDLLRKWKEMLSEESLPNQLPGGRHYFTPPAAAASDDLSMEEAAGGGGGGDDNNIIAAIEDMKRRIRGENIINFPRRENNKSLGNSRPTQHEKLIVHSNPARQSTTAPQPHPLQPHHLQHYSPPKPELVDDRSKEIIQLLQHQEARNERLLKEMKQQLDEMANQQQQQQQKQQRNRDSNQFSLLPAAVVEGNGIGNVGDLLLTLNKLRYDYQRAGGKDSRLLKEIDSTLTEAMRMQAAAAERGGSFAINPPHVQKAQPSKQQQELLIGSKLKKIEKNNEQLERELEKLQAKRLQKKTELLMMTQAAAAGGGGQKQMVDNSASFKPPRPESTSFETGGMKFDVDEQRSYSVGSAAGGVGAAASFQPTHKERKSLQPLDDFHLINNNGNGKQHLEINPSADTYLREFMIMLDFITGLPPEVSSIRLLLCVFNHTEKMADPLQLPMVSTEHSTRSEHADPESSALLQMKLPLKDCPPEPFTRIIVELQEVDSRSKLMQTRAWSIISLFDLHGNIYRGWWRSPFHLLPIKPHYSPSQLESVPQYSSTLLHYRIVDHSIEQSEADIFVNIQSGYLYKHTSQSIRGLDSKNFRVIPPILRGIDKNEIYDDFNDAPAPPKVPPDSDDDDPIIEPELEIENEDDDDFILGGANKELTLGFQVDRLKNATNVDIAKIRLTAYYSGSGEVVQSMTSPVTCSTSAVRSNFKIAYHVFGLQEATFYEVDFRPDMVLVVRVYSMITIKNQRNRLTKTTINENDNENADEKLLRAEEVAKMDEELIAWAILPLMIKRGNSSPTDGVRLRSMRVNTGTHTVQLYQPPVMDFRHVHHDKEWKPRDSLPYGQVNVRLHVFHPRPRAGSITPSDSDIEEDKEISARYWIPYERRDAPHRPYSSSDGFDLYVDSCRFLPDNVTVTKIRGRLLDRRWNVYGQQVACMTKLTSDVYNPDFDHYDEFREPTLPPSSTLFFKVYTFDRFTKRQVLIGFAALNVFVEIGTEKQPSSDRTGIQVALNEGGHQCRIFWRGPQPGQDPLYESWMRENRMRPVMCASILVRIVRAPVSPNGEPITRSQVPESEWAQWGLLINKPSYYDRVYYSMTCKPSRGELMILHNHSERPKLSLSDIVPELAAQRMETWDDIKKYYDTEIPRIFDGLNECAPFEISYVAQYVPDYGFKVSVDGATNLPWRNFTLVHYCLNPPGAIYLGKPHAAYDRILFSELLDPKSSIRNPVWMDSWKTFRHRSYHRHMTLIIHLQEIAVTLTKGNYKYSLQNQAWSALPIFEFGFVLTDTYQLPVFLGPPNREIFTALTQEPFLTFLERNISTLPLLEGASVIARVCDSRREEELTAIKDLDVLYLEQKYIPKNLLLKYQLQQDSMPITSMIPVGREPNEFLSSLVNKFKSLVYKLYEDDKILS